MYLFGVLYPGVLIQGILLECKWQDNEKWHEPTWSHVQIHRHTGSKGQCVSCQLSPGTGGSPPPGRPALCPPRTGSCWWRPAPPAGPCTPGVRGRIHAWSRCAPSRLLSERIHWSRKQVERESGGRNMSKQLMKTTRLGVGSGGKKLNKIVNCLSFTCLFHVLCYLLLQLDDILDLKG